MFGIIEFGLLLYNKQVITNASREGARAGIVVKGNPTGTARLSESGGSCSIGYPTQSIDCVVKRYAQTHLITFGTPNLVIAAPVCTVEPCFGQDLTVSVTYDYSFLVLSNFVPTIAPTITLSATTVMKYE